MNQRIISLPEEIDLADFFGDFDSNLKLLEKALGVSITTRDNQIKLSGEDENIEKAGEVINLLMQILSRGEGLDEQKILYAISMADEDGANNLKLLGDDCIAINNKGCPIKTKTLGQKKYVDAIKKNVITVCLLLMSA